MAEAFQPRKPTPAWFTAVDRVLRATIRWFTCTLLVLMVAFTIYTVVMRYVFRAPPFWGDTVSMFCNIWLVLIAYALAIRDREDIASEGLYVYLSFRAIGVLRWLWKILTLLFGVFLLWFGIDAALNVPGQYWELGGLPKKVPMLALPLAGLLVALVTTINIAEDVFGFRAAPVDGAR